MAVVGNPVLHSLSPVLMNAAIKENNLDCRYLRFPAKYVDEAIKTFKELGFKGLNVTAPFKQDVIPFLQHLTSNAERAQAVNTVYCKDGELWGDNTDIKGVELSLKKYPEYLSACKMLVIGSGGAAPAVIIAGQNLGLHVTVAARNRVALEDLKERLGVRTMGLQYLSDVINEFPVIVQALPSGAKVFDPEILTKDHIVLDANYKDSIFEKPSQAIGFKYLNGKNWLVNQAVPGFELFTGKPVAPEVMYKALDEYHFKYEGRIALTGFMGVGKTTSGRELAALTGYKFVDLDHEIEHREGMKISDIFKTKGEEYFRVLETKMLDEFADAKNIILSCGGGTIKSEHNRQTLREKFVNIWLYAPAAYCIDGLNVSNRPLLQCDNPLEAAEKLLAERVPLYVDSAYAIVNVENLNRSKVALKIYEQIYQTFGL